MSKPVSVPADSVQLVVSALRQLSASLQRSANKSDNPEIRALYERDKSRVDALIASFR